ncbi:hypothetical protein IWW34DRAFT_628967 [Fusarium oxysporum f. sp. albedinis]|nr:hypothetical protein IWW34DRAFT_628967 [Fusarium oxysporum f. sp. albedinis]
MKLSTIAFLLASLLAFLLGLFALENVAAGLERNESTTVIAAFDFVDMMSMLRTEDTFEDKKDTIPLWPVHQHLVTTHCSLLLCDSKRTPKASPSQKGAGFELVVSPTTMNPHFNHSS